MPCRATTCNGAFLSAFLIVGTATTHAQSQDTRSEAGLKNAVLGAEIDYGIVIVNGAGKRLRQFRATRGWGGRIDVAYFSPSIAADGSTALMVRCLGLQKEDGILRHDSSASGGCELVEADITTGRESVLWKPSDQEHLNSPIRHPSGKSIVVITEQEIIRLNYPSCSVATSVPIPELSNVRPWDQPEERPYLRWDESAQNLYVAGHRRDGNGARFDVGHVSFESNRVLWLPVRVPGFIYGKYSSDYHEMEDGVLYARQLCMKPEPVLLALFGDVYNPVVAPSFSPDRKYYFYVTRREGFFARGWIEGYDRANRTSFDVRTLWRHIYIE